MFKHFQKLNIILSNINRMQNEKKLHDATMLLIILGQPTLIDRHKIARLYFD